MSLSSLDCSNRSPVKNSGDVNAVVHQSQSQKLRKDIDHVVKSKFPQQQHTEGCLSPKSDNIELSPELTILVNKINEQQPINSIEKLPQLLIRYAVHKTEQLNTQLKEIGIHSCHLADVFLFLYIHLGLWYFELKNNNQSKDISSIKQNDFFLLPNEFSTEKLNKKFASKVFNPLDTNVKSHMYAYLISAFVTAQQKLRIGWDEFTNQNNVASIIEDIITSSTVIKEIIYHPNFYMICETNASHFLDNHKEFENTTIETYWEQFEFTQRSYKFYKKFLFSISINSSHVSQSQEKGMKSNVSVDKVIPDMFWFTSDNNETFIREIKLNLLNLSKVSELLINTLFRLLKFSLKSDYDLLMARQGKLSFIAWAQKNFNQIPPFTEGNYKFKYRLNYQYNLLSYYIFSYLELVSLFLNKVPHGYVGNPGRGRFTCEIINYHFKNINPNKLIVKHKVVKNHYNLMADFFCSNYMNICNNTGTYFGKDSNWLQRTKFFLVIEDMCVKFRNFSKQLLIHNQELQKYLEKISQTEKNQMESEYDLVKSHFMLPIFILNSLSIMEEQHKQLKIVDVNDKNIEFEKTDFISYEPNICPTYLDEINQFFVDDRYFQSHIPPNNENSSRNETLQELAPEPQFQSMVQTPPSSFFQPVSVSPLASTVEEYADECELPQATIPPVETVQNPSKIDEQALAAQPTLFVKQKTSQALLSPLKSMEDSEEKEVSFSRGIKVRKLIKELKELGFDLNRQTGSHAIFKLNNQQVVIPTSNDTLPRGTLESIEGRVNQIVSNKQMQ